MFRFCRRVFKAYISVSATTKEEAQVVEGKLARAVEEKM